MKFLWVFAALAASAYAGNYGFNFPKSNDILHRNQFFNLDLFEFNIVDIVEQEIEIALFDEFFLEEVILFSGSFFDESAFQHHQNFQQKQYNVRIPPSFPKGKGNLYVGKKGSFPSKGKPSNFYAYTPVQIQ